jgi:hypothetical protein
MPQSNNILEYKLFWPSLLGTVRTFVTTKVTDLGSTLLDREVTSDDVKIMKDIKLKDMEFVLPNEVNNENNLFIIKDKEGHSISFSNRSSTSNEMRGKLLRERLMQLRETDQDLTLLGAIENIFSNIEQSDLYKGLMTSLYTDGKPVHPRYQQAIAHVAKELVEHLRQNPNVSDDDLQLHGQNKMTPFFHQRDGLELVEDTLGEGSEQTKALGRVLLVMKQGDLTVNGQIPDSSYPLGEYLIHGGRIKFDISELSKEEQQEFFDFITNKQATTRAFASHRAAGIDASGSPAETKSGILGAASDAFQALVGNSKHYGINLPIGSADIPNMEGDGIGQYPQANGEWGHMYLHKDEGIVLVGVEASAPGKKNSRTNEAHSVTGATGEKSPFLQEKIDTEVLRNKQISEGHTPLSTKEKNNWASVKVTSEQFKKMKAADARLDNDYTSLARDLPAHHAPAKPNRFVDMERWAKATKQGNKTHWGPVALKILGGVLAAVGVAIMCIPIPGIAQMVGGGLASVGAAIIANAVMLFSGLATFGVGIGINRLGEHLDPGSNAPHLYAKATTEVEAPTPSQEFSQRPEQEPNNSLDEKLDNSNLNNKVLHVESPKPQKDKDLPWVMNRKQAETKVDEPKNSSSKTLIPDYKSTIAKGRKQVEPEQQDNFKLKK